MLIAWVCGGLQFPLPLHSRRRVVVQQGETGNASYFLDAAGFTAKKRRKVRWRSEVVPPPPPEQVIPVRVAEDQPAAVDGPLDSQGAETIDDEPAEVEASEDDPDDHAELAPEVAPHTEIEPAEAEAEAEASPKVDDPDDFEALDDDEAELESVPEETADTESGPAEAEADDLDDEAEFEVLDDDEAELESVPEETAEAESEPAEAEADDPDDEAEFEFLDDDADDEAEQSVSEEAPDRESEPAEADDEIEFEVHETESTDRDATDAVEDADDAPDEIEQRDEETIDASAVQRDLYDSFGLYDARRRRSVDEDIAVTDVDESLADVPDDVVDSEEPVFGLIDERRSGRSNREVDDADLGGRDKVAKPVDFVYAMLLRSIEQADQEGASSVIATPNDDATDVEVLAAASEKVSTSVGLLTTEVGELSAAASSLTAAATLTAEQRKFSVASLEDEASEWRLRAEKAEATLTEERTATKALRTELDRAMNRIAELENERAEAAIRWEALGPQIRDVVALAHEVASRTIALPESLDLAVDDAVETAVARQATSFETRIDALQTALDDALKQRDQRDLDVTHLANELDELRDISGSDDTIRDDDIRDDDIVVVSRDRDASDDDLSRSGVDLGDGFALILIRAFEEGRH